MAKGDAEEARGWYTSIDGIGALFRVDPRTVAEWIKLGMPRHSHGKYNVADCVYWRRMRDQETAKGGDGDLTEERRRLIVEQRRSHEIDNAQKAAELLPAEEVMSDMLAFSAIVASQLDAFPQRLAPRLVALTDLDVVRTTLADECRTIRSAAAEAFKAYGDSLGDGADHGPAAQKKRRGVGRRAPRTADRVAGAGAVAD